MIQFEKVRFKNFGSFGNYMVEVDIMKSPMTLIVGENGAGKSMTILDSIYFAIYGTPYRDINKPTIVNWINKKECLVECEFSINGSRFMIRRGISPTIFEIFKDGELIKPPAKATDYQKDFEEMYLKISQSSFKQICMLGKANFIPFLQLDAKPRRDTVDNIIGLYKFTELAKINTQKLTKLDKEITEIKSNINVVKNTISILTRQRSERIREREHRVSEIQLDISETEKEIAEHESTLKKKKIELEKADRHESGSLEDLQDELDELTKQESIANIKSQSANSEMNFFSKKSVCPICSQKISEKLKAEKIENSSQVLKDMEEANQIITEERARILTAMRKVKDADSRVRSIRSDIAKIETQIQGLQVNLSSLSKKLQSIKNTDFDDILSKINQELSTASEELTKLEAKHDDLLIDEYCLEYIQELCKDTGIKSKYIKNWLPILNHYIEKYVDELDLFCKISLDENFDETILMRHVNSCSYMSLSEGQKLRVDIAVLMAWREVAKEKNSFDSNLIVFDEILDSSMNEDGSKRLLKVLSQLAAKENKNIFIISHRPILGTDKAKYFDRVLNVRLKSNFSEIEETTPE